MAPAKARTALSHSRPHGLARLLAFDASRAEAQITKDFDSAPHPISLIVIYGPAWCPEAVGVISHPSGSMRRWLRGHLVSEGRHAARHIQARVKSNKETDM